VEHKTLFTVVRQVYQGVISIVLMHMYPILITPQSKMDKDQTSCGNSAPWHGCFSFIYFLNYTLIMICSVCL
jgi:hypothetical protein